jgi:hypothetical protein
MCRVSAPFVKRPPRCRWEGTKVAEKRRQGVQAVSLDVVSGEVHCGSTIRQHGEALGSTCTQKRPKNLPSKYRTSDTALANACSNHCATLSHYSWNIRLFNASNGPKAPHTSRVPKLSGVHTVRVSRISQRFLRVWPQFKPQNESNDKRNKRACALRKADVVGFH